MHGAISWTKGVRRLSKLMTGVVLVGPLLFGSGCVSNMWPGGPTPHGVLATAVVSPAQHLAVATDSMARSRKCGESSSYAILGLIAFGDSGLNKAMTEGGITRVHHVDHEVESYLLGLWLQSTTIVYGE